LDRRSEARSAPSADPVPLPRAPWSLDPREVAAALGVDPAVGLSPDEAAARLARAGPNRLREIAPERPLAILIRQFRSPVMAILAAAAAVAFGFGEWIDGGAIAVVLAVNASLGFVVELRAVRSVEALRRLVETRARVRRGGAVSVIPATDLVPGDIALIEAGDLVAADLRILSSSRLQANESALTGESAPVGKDPRPAPSDASLPERRSLLHSGTAVTRGAGIGVVIATGMLTELGRIAHLVEEAEEEVTPLEVRLDALARRLIALTVAIAIVPVAIGLARGQDLFHWISMGLALAVAAIPEGLPIVATIALARGMLRLSRRHALVQRLSAVEALGATGVILTDKTGTLTENRLTVRRIELAEGAVDVGADDPPFRAAGGAISPDPGTPLHAALRIALLCNDAHLGAGGDPQGGSGDPLEIALLAAGARAGLDRTSLEVAAPRVREEAFDPTLRLMGTVHETGDRVAVAVKGATEAVLARACDELCASGPRPLDDAARERWLARSRELAGQGHRVLALAERVGGGAEEPVYERLAIVALVALIDPPRREVAESIAACREAGIRVVMVTGDQRETARTIARQLGIGERERPEVVEGRELARILREGGSAPLGASVFARVDPEQKLAIVQHFQEAGEIVAMTGDGVNDAPALRKADIGVAMGLRGTEVAREAASMVLRDDSFASIVEAVRQGRVIFSNIRKFVFYLLSCNLSEVFIVTGATIIGTTLPILPLQVLFLNLVTDVFPALALAFGEGGKDVMRSRPRPADEPILTRRHWLGIGVYGLLITASVLASLLIASHELGFSEREAVTVSFLTLAGAQLWHVFSVREPGSGFRSDVVRNPWVWGALALCVALLGLAVHVPIVARVLQVTPLPAEGWLLVAAASVAPCLIGQIPVWRGWTGEAPADRGERPGAPR